MRVSNRHREATKEPHSLIVFPGALGDFVCFAAALDHVSRRDGRPPALLLKASLGPLVRALGLGTAFPLEGAAGAWLFSASPPPEADAFFGAFRSIECFSGTGVREVEKNVGRWAGAGGRVHPFRPHRPIHLALHFLERLGESPASVPQARWSVPPGLEERGADLLSLRSNGSRPVIVQPGSGGVEKRWSREGFRRIARRIGREGVPVRVVLGPAESTEAPFWRGAGLEVVEHPPLEALAGLLAKAGVCLGNDSGASHLAAAVGAAGVAVFGPTDEGLWRPLSSRWQVLRLSRWSAVDEAPDAGDVAAVEEALQFCLTG